MAYYAPPTEDLTLFNPDVFLTTDAGDFLTFPVAQGSQVFPFGLTASSITTTDPTTIDTLVMSDNNPAYEINYPVNSGRIDLYSNTAGGVSTRGCKIDATGVHTISRFDTIDETAGILNIGTNTARTGAINIGTGTSAKTTTIGGTTGTTTLSGGTINIDGAGGNTTTISNTGILTLSNGSGSAMNIGSNKTGGTIDIGQVGATSASHSVNIATGSNYTGPINIGTGAGSKSITIGGTAGSTTITGQNALLRPSTSGLAGIGDSMGSGEIRLGRVDATATSTAINIGVGTGSTSLISIGRGSAIAIQNGATTTLTAAVPIQVSYSGTAPTTAGTTAIGFTNSSSNNTFTQSVAAVYDILSFNLTSGVWLVEGCFVFSGATGGGRKLSITTTSASSANDRANGVPTGTFGSLQVATVFAFSSTTTVYLTIDITAALGGSGTNFTTARWTRIA